MDAADLHETEHTSWGIAPMARTVGHLTWFHRGLAEVLAAWSRSTPDHRVAVALAEQARQRAWHAELWFARLPALRELPAEPLVVPARPALEELLVHLGGLGAPVEGEEEGSSPSSPSDGTGVELRLAVLTRVVLPHEVSVVGRVAARCTPAADRALLRTTGLVRRDLLEHWEVLAGLADERGTARPADGPGDRRTGRDGELARVEALLVADGGIAERGIADRR